MLRIFAVSAVATALAVAINIATDNVGEPLAWIATVALTVLAAGLAYRPSREGGSDVRVRGRRNVVRQQSSADEQSLVVRGSDNDVDQS